MAKSNRSPVVHEGPQCSKHNAAAATPPPNPSQGFGGGGTSTSSCPPMARKLKQHSAKLFDNSMSPMKSQEGSHKISGNKRDECSPYKPNKNPNPMLELSEPNFASPTKGLRSGVDGMCIGSCSRDGMMADGGLQQQQEQQQQQQQQHQRQLNEEHEVVATLLEMPKRPLPLEVVKKSIQDGIDYATKLIKQGEITKRPSRTRMQPARFGKSKHEGNILICPQCGNKVDHECPCCKNFCKPLCGGNVKCEKCPYTSHEMTLSCIKCSTRWKYTNGSGKVILDRSIKQLSPNKYDGETGEPKDWGVPHNKGVGGDDDHMDLLEYGYIDHAFYIGDKDSRQCIELDEKGEVEVVAMVKSLVEKMIVVAENHRSLTLVICHIHLTPEIVRELKLLFQKVHLHILELEDTGPLGKELMNELRQGSMKPTLLSHNLVMY